MRYLIDTEEETVKRELERLEKEEKITLIERGDPLEIIKGRLLKIKKAVEALKESGLNKDIMIAYIRTKGIARRTIEDVLNYQNEFFEKLTK